MAKFGDAVLEAMGKAVATLGLLADEVAMDRNRLRGGMESIAIALEAGPIDYDTSQALAAAIRSSLAADPPRNPEARALLDAEFPGWEAEVEAAEVGA